MSGFAPDWLKLREPADHRARDRALLMRLAAHFSGRDEIAVVDLGSGLGSNLRATAPALPARQTWLLVDHDPDLLAAAREEIARWADASRTTAAGIEAEKSGIALRVELKQHDLAADPAPWGAMRPDLVTASALFDLVSGEWIDRFSLALARSGAALYSVLTHNGPARWRPPHPADQAMQAAFERHFARDKGFGGALGWLASIEMANDLARAGYDVRTAQSPWVLRKNDRPLIAALAEGWADAVRETGLVSEADIREWLAARTADGVACFVGHEDLLALPRGD